MRTRRIWFILFSISFKIHILKMKREVLEEVIYGWIRGLEGRIPDCKLAMHANCFNDIWKSMIHDLGSRQNGSSNRLDRLKSYCHHSLRDLHAHTDGAWWKLEKYYQENDLSEILLFCVCVWPAKKGNYCMVCSNCCASFPSYISY